MAERTVSSIESMGCGTSATTLSRKRTGEIVYLRKKCDYMYCWPIPPDRRVIDVLVVPMKHEGAANYWAPIYKPSEPAATEVCFHYYAISAAVEGAIAEIRTRIRIATIHRLSADDLHKLSNSCIEQGAD